MNCSYCGQPQGYYGERGRFVTVGLDHVHDTRRCRDGIRRRRKTRRRIPGFPWYEIDTRGLIYRGPDHKPLCTQPNSTIVLRGHGQQNRANRSIPNLVLRTFAGSPSPGQRARHIDGDRTNNRLENLEWA